MAEFTTKSGARLAYRWYEKDGRFFHPPLIPYSGILFEPTPTSKEYRVEGQWDEAVGMLFREVPPAARPIMRLPPSIQDIRPFLRLGYVAEVTYTYLIGLEDWAPDERVAQGVRQRINKARKAEYVVKQVERHQDLITALSYTEQRQGIDYSLTEAKLDYALKIMTPAWFRIYVCYDHDEVIGGELVLFDPLTGFAFELATGNHPSAFRNGVAQFMRAEVFADLRVLGGKILDLLGGNIQPVAQSKAELGGRLIPCFSVYTPTAMIRLAVKRSIKGRIRKLGKIFGKRSLDYVYSGSNARC